MGIIWILIIQCEDKKDYNIDLSSEYTSYHSINVYGDGSSYCAFTTLIQRDNFFYLAFREGNEHVADGDYGVIRILSSNDCVHWSLIQTINIPNIDLRDPNLSIAPEGNLFLICGGRTKLDNGELVTNTYYSFETNNSFETPHKIWFPNDIYRTSVNWLWKLTWHNNKGYGVVYHKNGADIVETVDGINYILLSHINQPFVNESRIRFLINGEAIALFRATEGGNGYIGNSKPPYTEWTYTQLNYHLSGQDFIITSDTIYCVSRSYDKDVAHTALYLSRLNGEILHKYILLSSGDTSYAGIVEYNGYYYISYYSMHKTPKPAIYIEKISQKAIKF